MPKRSKALCGVCSEPSTDKFATFYWHWTWPSGDQRGYKQFMDAQCAYVFLQALYRADTAEMCGICLDELDDERSVYVWVTYYIPGREREDFCFDFHENCLVDSEEMFSRNAQRLAPRGVGAGGPPLQPRGNAWESWDQQGLKPA